MRSSDDIVLTAATAALRESKVAWLCTVAKTFGASPRSQGALLLLSDDGQLSGSLSGGCIEDDLLQRLAEGTLAKKHPELIEFGLSAEENERFGLPCGGRMQILVERLDARHLPLIERVSSALSSRRAIRRLVCLQSGDWQLAEREYCAALELSEDRLQQDFGPHYQLLLVGANELARCITEIALAMDYRVLVTDPRPERLDQWPLPGVELVSGMPDDVVRQRASDNHSIVITLTHDPRIDDMALMEALTQPLFYVGALGSQRTSDKRRQRLLELDVSEAQLAKLRAPVGLAIGSKTAMEIAVAIMAELTSLRAKFK
ncbi:xanthine and CO dehydrogenases maturation factor, XdhC/CoxF family [Spongiibacter sp. IMCC21906]|uniref:XdhC family protein n=1 Tax=Spongiibacter sp. IMCC21906 TaxID=1620392 RepID=UPI00062DDA1E|nr:XdhC family protein [Spongiibacter sp. IMCC21906]AKH69971.1 xanthine and CO dehydrogenases maturation factor, XdhC/CoxF family [Spongiibacter sp. IMCC21906]